MALPQNDLRVLIVADDPLARAGLATLIGTQPGYVVSGQTHWDVDMAAQVEVYRPDVAVWSLGRNPEQVVERLVDVGDAGPPVVALLPDESHAADAWAAGARGLLFWDTGAETLASALSTVAQGLVVFDPALVSAAQPVPEGRERPPSAPSQEFTPRELEVLHLLVEGLPNKVIAQRLGISEHTVKFHINTLFSKLGVQSRTEAVTRAVRQGLIML